MPARVTALRLLGERLVADHHDGRVRFMSFTEHPARAVPSRLAAAALAVLTAMVLAGCGGAAGATQAPAPSAAPTSAASAAASAPAGTDAGSSSGAGSCGEATAALVRQHLTAPEIVSITTEGGCHDTTIVTTLAASDFAKAQAICESAAVIAYAGDLLSVTVTGANNKELAIGIKGQPCIGEP
jgi:hypothetical protein